jgi:hypothetical protein
LKRDKLSTHCCFKKNYIFKNMAFQENIFFRWKKVKWHWCIDTILYRWRNFIHSVFQSAISWFGVLQQMASSGIRTHDLL